MENVKYAEQLLLSGIPESVVEETTRIFQVLPQTSVSLSDPSISLEKRHEIIDSIFPHEVRPVLKELLETNSVSAWNEIAGKYENLLSRKKSELLVRLRYVTRPSEDQILLFRKFIENRYKTQRYRFILTEDRTIGGGFILEIGNDQYDWSTGGRRDQFIKDLQNVQSKLPSDADILSILTQGVSSFSLRAEKKEIGFVKTIGDGICIMDGLDHCMYGEMIEYDTGLKGMVLNIEASSVGVILFGDEGGLSEGSRGMRTGRMMGVPVGRMFLGRVVNALGEPIDGKGRINAEEYMEIERPAPGILDRQPVKLPLQTGILAIDSMFPIGRGQRELIIGDRQTGKTSIALDTIINQKGKNCICIYVAIGQKASTVASIHKTLEEKGAMEYSCIVSSPASETHSMQYIAPFAATSLAEYFMHLGRDVLIVYDDLSKHAVAYRTLSLLLGRSPGREAYPGDVFYLHSRLLERSARLSEKKGGGSITALPIIETQDGDVSSYIPTNVISITDGQIFLETGLFFQGQRPAVNVGLSVSRVGGAAQTKAMKKASGSLRIDLAQYREMAVFTQFSSDLDENTKRMLNQGKNLMELLKQPLGDPLKMTDEVILLTVALSGMIRDLQTDRIAEFKLGLRRHFETRHADTVREIEMSSALSDDLKEKILKEAEEFLNSF